MRTCNCEPGRPTTDVRAGTGGIDNFKVARYEFVIEARGPLFLPPYKGSTFRGGFGTAFKNVSCSDRRNECRKCLLRHACPYAYIFETAPPEGSEALTKFEQVPHPFVLEPPLTQKQEFAPGDEFTLGLVLIGRGIEFLPYFIVAFQEFGKTGIGRGRGRFNLARAYTTTRGASRGEKPGGALPSGLRATEETENEAHRPLVFDGRTNKVYVRDAVVGWKDIQAASTQLLQQVCNTGADSGPPLYTPGASVVLASEETSMAQNESNRFKDDPQDRASQDGARPARSGMSRGPRLTVTFETMTRLKYQGSLNERPEFHVLVRSLLRRVSSLLYFHHGTKLDMDFRGFISQAEKVRLVAQHTQWVDWERYSSRQDTRMKLGGIVGTVTYEFPDPDLVALFLPWLLLGEYVHVGKGGTFGLGRFDIRTGG